MDLFRQDLRYALRGLRRQPGFALATILTLSIGIGATAAIFTLVNAVVFRPLPLPGSDRVVAVLNFFSTTGRPVAAVSAPDFHDWHEQSRSFAALAYYTGGETSVSVDGAADYANAYRVTPDFYAVLGTPARLGRLPTAAEQRPGGPLTAVVSDAFWRRRLGARADALGTRVTLGQRVYDIVGVLPPELRVPARADVFYPAWVVPETPRSAHNYRAIGRLADGVSVARANEELGGIARRLEEAYPDSNRGKLVSIVPLDEYLVGDTRRTLLVLLAAVALVLLIACANVANLLLARATGRAPEMAVRAAIGAGRGRLIRQLLTESLVLALASGVTGVLLAAAGLQALLALAPADLPRLDEVSLDRTALLFAIALSALSSLLFGLAPALQVSRAGVASGLRTGGKGAPLGAPARRLLGAFVVVEVALAVVLVFGAGLLGRSLGALTAVEMGFDEERLLVLRTTVPVASFSEASRAAAFYREVLPELAAIPGVERVAGVTSLPTAVRSNGGYWIEGGPGPEQLGLRSPQAIFNVTTHDYFATMRIPLRSGRDFTAADTGEAPLVAIVNETLAREAFPGQDPIGRRLRTGLDRPEFMTIVGVAADVRTWGPARPAQAEIYMPFQQHPGPATALVLVARTASPDPSALAETLRRVIRGRNPEVPVRAETMAIAMDAAAATPRFRTFLVALFAGVALLLSLVGVYGVMAWMVGQRVPEFGLRLALGATPGDVLRLVLRQGGKLAAAGVLAGLLLCVVAARAVQSFLFGVTAGDPVVVVAVVAGVSLAALLACYLPSRRVLRVDPVCALRSE